MSHFVCMVIGDNVEDQLQPYHEYECTGVMDEHVVFVDEHDEVLNDWNEEVTVYKNDAGIFGLYDDVFYVETGKLDFLKRPEKRKLTESEILSLGYKKILRKRSDDPDYKGSIVKFADDYHGYSTVQDGRIGRMTNPNAKWDWWVVGGRWTDMFNIAEGKKSDFDLEGTRGEAESRARSLHKKLSTFSIDDGTKTWDEILKQFDGEIEKARDMYWNQPFLKRIKNESSNDDDLRWLDNPVSIARMPEKEYIESKRIASIVPFAFVIDGKWVEKGDMGWWGCVSDEKDQSDWNKEFSNMFDDLSDDTQITIVDCHI